LRVENSGR